MKKFVISIPYVYPACPLNIDHAKLFVLADVVARNQRALGKEVIFPVAAHYSGVAADTLYASFKEIDSTNYIDLSESQKKLLELYTQYYKTPRSILKSFKHPKDLLDFYSQEILWELKSLNVSCDYDSYYSTDIEDYSIFVSSVMSQYKSKKLFIENNKNELALNYDDGEWRQSTLDQIKKTTVIQDFHKNNIISAVQNIRNDWGILRSEGIGVSYLGKWVIDPMFDSELFTLFDVYRTHTITIDLTNSEKKIIFDELLNCLNTKEKPKNSIVKKIINDLPCDIFIGEEHLKNWIVKKMYAETMLMKPTLRTSKYFVVGMGQLNGQRMSASKGTAILAKNLIHDYGENAARISILLCGGHPSKNYSYDANIPKQAIQMIENFLPIYQQLKTFSCHIKAVNKELLYKLELKLQNSIDNYYFKQAIIDLLVTIPKSISQDIMSQEAATYISVFDKYLSILIPGLYSQLA